jgi:hypothetical protein
MRARLLGILALVTLWLPVPAFATSVTVHCWCQQTTSLICNHNTQHATVHGTLVDLAADDSQIAISTAFSDANREMTCNVCRTYCASLTGGPWRNTNCDPSYDANLCHACNADPTSSCTEAQGARLSVSQQQDRARQQQLAAQCEAQTAHPIFPIQLGTPIGGVSQVNGLAEYINVAYRYLVSVVLVVAIVMTVYGGFRYLFGASAGSVGAGKEIIRDALIGMLIVLGAYTLLATINPATTILGLNPPEPIACQDINLPAVAVHSRCASDTECSAGQRCVEAHNVVYDFHECLSTFSQGSSAGAAAGQDLATTLNNSASSFVGEGGEVTGFSPLDALINSYLQTNAAITSAGLTTAGAVVGGDLSGAACNFFALRAAANNIHLCSSLQQGSPCTQDRYCDASLTCVPGWELCWPPHGNGPGMPCNPNIADSCSGSTCEAVPGTEMHVCQIQARDSTPCFYPNGSATAFPPACGAPGNSDAQYTCAWCPSGQHGEARVWTYLAPGMQFPGQCKPRAVLTTQTNCAQ